MKKIKFYLFMTLSIFLLSACGNKVDNAKKEKEEFTENVVKIIDVIKNNEYNRNNFSSYYNYYNLVSNELIGYNYNSEISALDYNLKYDVSNMNLNVIRIIDNKLGEVYLSIQNDKYCAVKNFKDEQFNVFDVNDFEKCNIDVVDGEEIFVGIVGFEIGTTKMLSFNEISSKGIELKASTNILDTTYCSYRWFRDGIEIKNSNVPNYVINSDENAFYSVEVITADGKVMKSNSIHVVIKK